MRRSGGEFGLLLLSGFWSLLGGNWRRGKRGRKHMDGGGRIIRVSKLQTGKGGNWQGRKAQLNMRVFAFPKDKDNQFCRIFRQIR